MLTYAEKATKRPVPVAKPRPAPISVEQLMAFASERYSKIIARLAE